MNVFFLFRVFLERSQSARLTLQKAFEFVPEEVGIIMRENVCGNEGREPAIRRERVRRLLSVRQ